MIVILAIVGTGMLWLGFGRHVLLSRANTSESSQQLALGVLSLAQACLQDTGYGNADCSLPPLAGCVPASVGGRSVSVSSAGSPPDCRLSVTVGD